MSKKNRKNIVCVHMRTGRYGHTTPEKDSEGVCMCERERGRERERFGNKSLHFNDSISAWSAKCLRLKCIRNVFALKPPPAPSESVQ